MLKAHDVATLQKLLKWLRWKDKCWCSLTAKKSMLHNNNKQLQKIFVKRKSHGMSELKKKKKKKKKQQQQQRERASILITSLSKKKVSTKKKKKRHNFFTLKKYHTTHSKLLVQFNEYPRWLYIEKFLR